LRYTLSQGVVPEAARKHIPRYPLTSATLIGRLAVQIEYQGHGIGTVLLARALRMAYESASRVGSSMVVVDAIDERAARFYEAFGFIRLLDSMRLILPTQTIARLIEVGPTRADRS
jgi:predicted GNAT family N-acyltransferase